MPALNLRIKVLIPVTVMILAAFTAALITLNHVVRRQVLAGVSMELERARRIFQELQEKEWELLLERGWVTAAAPHLKAAVDTGDSTTVQHVADEIFDTLRSDFLIVTDHRKRLLAQHGLQTHQIGNFHIDSLIVQGEKPEGEIGLLKLGEDMYRVVSAPILALDEITGGYLLGEVVLGKRIDRTYLRDLKNLVKCEIVFTFRKNVLVNTFTETFAGNDLRSQLTTPLKNDHSFFQINIGKEEFLAERAGLRGNYILLQSVDQSFKPIMKPIELTMILVGGFAVLIAILISRFISHGIVSPVKKLVNATDAITAGEYERPIEPKRQDEIGDLAKKLDEMRQALQQKMTQLKQQNLDLENALKKLEATQEELVRSERLAATGRITAQLSHELNNPIHNIQGCLEAAQKRVAKEQTAREFIDLAYDEVLRIGKLIRQMTDFYRPQMMNKRRVNINQVLQDVLKSSENLFEEKSIVLFSNLNSQIHEINSSPDQLKQVFLNLILNAIDAMPNGGELQVSSILENSTLSIVIEDTGYGIAPSDLDKIFDAFFTTKAKASGVGLGLTVSYGIIRSLGGTILVESELNQGSKFTVQLPLPEKERIT
ncbi:HAMP domain-containing protein [Candidatus Saccharibacteria bacterium]|nr:HAMP domain-containing protein [Candidatus Saccharibacteria bacterium]NIW78658.1 HAMP domain-containing protein [Calditrichia bacterium]